MKCAIWTERIGSKSLRRPRTARDKCNSDLNPYYCGLGWKTSLHQYTKGVSYGDTRYYVWVDGDGTEHWFKRDGSEPFTDEEGMGYKLTTNLTASPAYMIIDDKSHNRLKFERPSGWTDGYLSSMRDAQANQADITWAAEGKISKVVDAAGRTTTFAYTGDLLSSITYPGNQSVHFTYTSNRLTGIRYSDLGGTAAHTVYGYDGATGILTTAKNYDGMRVDAGYEALSIYNADRIDGGADNQMRRITSLETVKVNASNAVIARGAKQIFTYKDMCTEVRAVDTASSDAGKTLTYQFNDQGNVMCVKDELGYAQFTKYSSSFQNTPVNESSLQKAVVNRIRYPDMKEPWSTQKANSADTVARDTATTCISVPSLKIIKTTSGGESRGYQSVTVERDKHWTFSAYIKTTALTGGNAFVRLNGVSSDLITGTTTGSGGPGADGWERVSVTVKLTGSGTQAVNAELISTASGGTAWFACPQLEEGVVANHVNLVTNGDFRRTVANGTRQFPEDWTAGENVSSSAQNGVFTPGAGFPSTLSGSKCAQVIGLPDKANNGFTQTINIIGKKNDVVVIGGWANGQSVPNANSIGRGFGLAARYQKTDGTWSSYKMLAFNQEWVGWQFGCFPAKIDDDYKNLEILCVYTKNANTAQFSNIFVYREEFGQTYAYDSKKNLTSVTMLSGQQSEQKYDDFDNMTSYVQPGRDKTNDKYAFDYGSTDAEKKKHLVKRSKTPMKVQTENQYDAYGNLTETKTRNADTATPFIQSKTTYTANENFPLTKVDARGKTTTMSYNADKGTLTSVKDPNNQQVNYQYDTSNRVKNVSTTADGKTYSNAYTYENDRIKTVSHNTTSDTANDVTYTFDYDEMGNQSTVKVGSQVLSRNVYSTDRSRNLERVEYGNGGKITNTYDGYDRLTGVKYDSESANRYTYEYGAHGGVARVTDAHLNRVTTTEYDLANRPRQVSTRAADNNALIYQTTLNYDNYNNLSLFRERVGTDIHQTTYAYDRDNRTTGIEYGASTRKVAYAYDGLGRITTKTVTNGSNAAASTYGFIAGGHGSDSTTSLVGSITQPGQTLTYDYDDVGNIVKEKRAENGTTKETTYKYDKLGQLTRVNDPHANVTWTYEYDCGGNITIKKRYAYTVADTLGTPAQTVNYGYTNGAWKDRLETYGGKKIRYDLIGNPESYDGWQYEWQAGRQLKKMTQGTAADSYGNAKVNLSTMEASIARGTNDNGDTLSLVSGELKANAAGYSVAGGELKVAGVTHQTLEFKYDANGLRTQKIVTANGAVVTTDYVLHGKLLVELRKGNDKLHFFYDAHSEPSMIKHGNNYYTYLRNSQGDILAIVDSAGNKVVEYRYDAWGKILATSGSMAGTLGKLNPFRYRGYVYDEETGLYYLQSRFYNPEWGRFLNADEIATTADNFSGPLSTNLFAYCMNNPVNKTDENGGWGLPNWAKVAIGVVATVGAVALTVATGGAAAPVLIGVATSTLGGAGISAVSHRVTTGSWDGAGDAALNGAADGFMWGGVGALETSIISTGIKALQTSKQGITIGRNMEAVRASAKTTGTLTYSEGAPWGPMRGKYYQGLKKVFSENVANKASLACNKFYIKTMRFMGTKIYDSGLNGYNGVGMFYGMELRVLEGYSRLIRRY